MRSIPGFRNIRRGEKNGLEKKEKGYICLSILLLVWMAVFAFVNGSCQSFWADELASIGYIRSGINLVEMFQAYLHVDTNLPLYSLVLYGIYRIVPYGEKFLLIPSILFCVLGIAALAYAAKKVKGSTAGFLAVCIGTASSTLLWQGAWEIRCYAMVFCLSSFTLLAYVNKSLNNIKKNVILYGVALFLLLWSHWFALLLTASYGLADLFFMLRKKLSWKNIFPYLIAGGSLCPWFVIVYLNQQHNIADYWTVAPTWRNTVWTVLFLLSGRRVLWYVCLLSCAALIVYPAYKLFIRNVKPLQRSILGSKKRTWDITKEEILCVQCVLSLVWVIGITFLYSYFINPQGSMYVERYFMVIMPHVFFVTVCGICRIIEIGRYVIKKLAKQDSFGSRILRGGFTAIIAVWMVIELVLCYRDSYISIRKPMEDYRGAAEFLIKDKGIWKKTSLFIGNNRYCVFDGFVDYYFTKRGLDEPYHAVDGMVNLPEENRFYPNYKTRGKKWILQHDKIYSLKIHMDMGNELKQFVKKYYTLDRSNEKNGIEIWKRKKEISNGLR